jgi:hypothetical protein
MTLQLGSLRWRNLLTRTGNVALFLAGLGILVCLFLSACAAQQPGPLRAPSRYPPPGTPPLTNPYAHNPYASPYTGQWGSYNGPVGQANQLLQQIQQFKYNWENLKR